MTCSSQTHHKGEREKNRWGVFFLPEDEPKHLVLSYSKGGFPPFFFLEMKFASREFTPWKKRGGFLFVCFVLDKAVFLPLILPTLTFKTKTKKKKKNTKTVIQQRLVG